MRIRIRATPLILAALLAAPRLPAQSAPHTMPDSVRDYIRTAMTTFRNASVHRAEVDWPALEDSVVARSAGARASSGTWAALTWALRRVDPHSFLMPPASMMKMSGMVATARMLENAQPVGRMVGDHIALVRVSGHSGANRATYVDSLQSAIRTLASDGACGWVVDLRDDTGGNMWPMLAGVGPLFGAEVVGSFTSGSAGAAWHYRDGRSWNGDSTPPGDAPGWGTGVPLPPVSTDVPVALLIGRRTASSGEMTLLAFLGRPNMRTFGDSTAGFNSVNQSIPLPDGATLIVTSAYPRDRLGRAYGLKVAPDELVPSDASYAGDAVLRRAVAWLGGQSKCAGRR